MLYTYRRNQGRDRTYDGWVVPRYADFVHNSQVCANITVPTWNPPTNVVEKWVTICMPAVWWPSNRLRAICLKPLRLDEGDQALEQITRYVDEVQTQIEAIVREENSWPLMETVDSILLPVNVAGTWSIYMTQKSTKQQSVIRIASSFRRVEADNKDAPGAAYNLDRVMHTMGVSAMGWWLRAMIHGMRGDGLAVNLGRDRAEEDIVAKYGVIGEARLTADVMTPGTVTMYLLQGLLLQDQNQVANVVTAYKTLQRAEALGGNQAKYCRQKMQFAFAANQHVGVFADDAYQGKPDAQPIGGGERLERRRRTPMQEPPREEERKEGRDRDSHPRRGYPHGNQKRDKKDRKYDRRHDSRRDRKQ